MKAAAARVAILLCTFGLCVIAVHPSSAKPQTEADHVRRALELQQQGDMDGVIAEYRAALQLNPNNASEHHNLGVALSRKGDLDGAIAELKVAVRMEPDSAKAHYTLGAVLEKKGDLKSALEEYRRASQLEPSNGDIRRAYESVSHKLKP